MDNRLITEIFDSPELASEIHQFCLTFPEYRQASAEMNACAQKMIQRLGFEEYNRFERVANYYHGLIAQAHYFFGLRLRREICAALME